MKQKFRITDRVYCGILSDDGTPYGYGDIIKIERQTNKNFYHAGKWRYRVVFDDAPEVFFFGTFLGDELDLAYDPDFQDKIKDRMK